MKNYEINYFLPPELNEEETQKIVHQVNTLIQEQDGLLGGERRTNKNKLGYQIRGREEAIMIVSQFQLEPQKINDLKQNLAKIKSIMRFMVLINQPRPPKPLRLRKKPITPKTETLPSKTQVQVEAEAPPKKPIKEKKVELQEIEKKLDELLE